MLTYRTGTHSNGVAQYLSSEQVPAIAARYYGRDAELRPDISSQMQQRLGIDNRREPLTEEHITRLLDGQRASDGVPVEGRRQQAGRVQFVDFTFSATKQASVAWALGSDQERMAITESHRAAVGTAMRYVESQLGHVRRGAEGSRGTEPGEIAWIAFHHYTSRPVGKQAADPNLHTHAVAMNSALTASGHVGSLNLNMLRHRVHEIGAVYAAAMGTELRQRGVTLTVPQRVADHFSKRTKAAREMAQDYAKAAGLDWASLPEANRIMREKVAAHATRQDKSAEPMEQQWQRQAEAIAYHHKPQMGRAMPLDAAEGRRLNAYKRSLGELATVFESKNVVHIGDVRRVAAQGLATTGISRDAAADVDAVVELYRQKGVIQRGQVTQVEIVGDKVTTALHVTEERRAIDIAGRLHAQGRITGERSAAGSGKSTRLSEMADGWRSEGRQVWATAIAWRQVVDLPTDRDHKAALMPFLHRVERGKFDIRRGDVIAVDEVALIGTRSLLNVLKIAEDRGASLHLIGDDKQANSPEAGHVMQLLEQAGVTLVEHTQNFRQRSERDQETTLMWREGRAAEALSRLDEDGHVLLAADRNATVAAAAARWTPDGPLILTPDNRSAREISEAVRELRRERGEIGRDLIVIEATDPNNGQHYKVDVAAGDRLRLFDQVFDGKTHIGDNGSVVEVLDVKNYALTVRNVATGANGRFHLDEISSIEGTRLSPGYAGTVHSNQGSTVERAVFVMANGSSAVDAHLAYTALSRHRANVDMIVNAQAERDAIALRRPLGERGPISDAAVRDNVARNLGRHQETELASTVVRQGDGKATDNKNSQELSDGSEYLARLMEVGRQQQTNQQTQGQSRGIRR